MLYSQQEYEMYSVRYPVGIICKALNDDSCRATTSHCESANHNNLTFFAGGLLYQNKQTDEIFYHFFNNVNNQFELLLSDNNISFYSTIF